MGVCYCVCATLKRIAFWALLLVLTGLSPGKAQSLLDIVQSAQAAAAQGETKEALSLFNRALSALETAPDQDANIAFLQNEIAALHRRIGDYDASITAANAAVELGQRANAPASQRAIYRYNLALALFDNADYAAAEAELTTALNVADMTDDTVQKINILRERGKSLQVIGSHQEALADFRTALSLAETVPALRPELLRLATTNLLVSGEVSAARRTIDLLPGSDQTPESDLIRARVLIAEGALQAADNMLNDVLSRSTDQVLRASVLYNQSEIAFARGDYPGAARHNLAAQAIYSRVFGPDSYAINRTTHRQAVLLLETGDYASSLDLFSVAQERTEALFGPDHPTWIATEIEKSSALVKLGNVDAALVSLRNLRSRNLSARSGLLAQSALGLTLYDEARFEEAKAVLIPVVNDWQSGNFGLVDGPPTMIALADIYAGEGNWNAATVLIDDVIARLQARGATSIDRLSQARRIKAKIALGQGDLSSAETLIGQNLRTGAEQIARLALSSGFGVNYAPLEIRKQVAQGIEHFWQRSGQGQVRPLSEDMFFAMQLIHLNETSAAALGTFSASQDQFAPLLSQRQDLVDELRVLQSRQLALVRERDANSQADSSALIGKIATLEERLAQLDLRLRRDAPDALAFLSPAPVDLLDVQSSLGPTEALWLHVSLEDASFMAYVTNTAAQVTRVARSSQQLARDVSAIRETLDFNAPGGLPVFASDVAAELYEEFIDRPRADLAKPSTLFVIPDGALQQLSLAVLVSGRHDGARPRAGDRNADLRFLGHELALAHLPSPQFLVQHARRSSQETSGGLIGFGDPVLEGSGTATTRALAATFDKLSGLAKPGVLRSTLQPLPASRIELETIREIAAPRNVSLFLGKHASETQVRAVDYQDVETLIFATHALVAGEFTDLAEPALVLTPPARANANDDGLLLASEIMQLDLNAKLVVLSACNTGSSSGRPGAPGLSGLARAFWLAGVENMLVSHWTISSRSAALLTPRFYLTLQRDPNASGAEALRQAMVAVANNPSEEIFAHPAFWGAFSMIGRG